MAMGSAAGKVATALVALCCVVFVAQADEYNIVWNFNVQGWGSGRSFTAGDVIAFEYIVGAHNVVEVDQAGYDACSPGADARTHSSGYDRITLHRGTNYFICGFPGHCSSGMKIAVTAH